MRTTAGWTLAIALCVLCGGAVGAQVGGRDLPRAVRTVAGVTVNRDSAASIRAKLGRTRERTVGTGHDEFVAWCYVSTDPSSRTLLELMSDASVMGTPGHELNVIRLRAEAPPEERAGCAPLHASARLSTKVRLRLGLDAAKVQGILGRPTRTRADSLVYEFATKQYLQPGTPPYERWNTMEYRESCFDAGPPYANVAATVIVLLRDDRAVEVRIERYDQEIC